MRLLLLGPLSLVAIAAAAPPSVAPEDKPEQAAGPGNKMICKRFAETGSLVNSYRACKTKREWERERDNRRTMTVGGSCPTLTGCQ